MIEAWAPGKLFIAGEYAVVDAGEPAVLIAVDRGIRVRLTEHHEPRTLDSSDHVRAACLAVEELRASRSLAARSYDLQIESDLEDRQGQKFGLGSSAAVTVAVVAALNQLYDLKLNAFERFQLALLATIEVTPKASGGDLAASTFGGWIRYAAPDRSALKLHRAQHGIAATLERGPWNECDIIAIPAPRELRLLVGWTGTPASTSHLVDGVQQSAAAVAAAKAVFLDASRESVNALVTDLEQGGPEAPAIIRRLRRLLQNLGKTTGIDIETDRLRALCDAAERSGAAGKPSGAGGGDCGIVLAGPNADVNAVLNDWKANGIVHLDLSVQPGEGGFDER